AARFFADETDDFEGGAHRYLVFADRAHRFEGADDSDRSVILAAVDHGIEMGPGQYRGRPWIGSLEAAEDVTDGVDADIQPGLAHQMDQDLAAAQLFDRKYQT